jgi:LysR family glycine cleavage system transcriptional activator
MTDRPISLAPLGALRAFEAAVRLGSFKAAAAALSVTPAAISHQVKALEAYVGTALFERLNRALRLTRAGQALALVVQGAFDDLDRALAELRERSGSPAMRTALSVSAAPSFAAKWLAPRLHRLQAAHPGLDIRLSATDTLADLATIDIALRYGRGPYPGVNAERLWPDGEIFPVCRPDLRLKSPRDLLRQTLLRTAPPQSTVAVPRTDWPAWFKAAGVSAPKAGGHGPMFSGTHLALEAAAAGQGIALTPGVLVAGDLAAGRLARPFPAALPDPYGFWLLSRETAANRIRIRAFTGWIRSEIRDA